MSTSSSTVVPSPSRTIADWGRTPYDEACQRQEELLRRRVAGEIPDTLVFTEHPPVYTLGVRKGAGQNLLWNELELRRAGIEVRPTNRGGDITYHGPGQIVGYPIVSLAPRPDLHAYLRFLELVLIDAVGTFGLAADRRAGKTGIWLGPRKVAAIGIAVKKWTTYHGFALNVNNDLAPYAGIIPCGIPAAEGTVTSMARELGRALDLDEVKTVLAQRFWARWHEFLNETG